MTLAPLQTCPSCHYAVPADARWCPFCGWAPPAPVMVYNVTPPGPTRIERVYTRTPKPFVGPITGCLVLAVLVFLFAMVIGAMR